MSILMNDTTDPGGGLDLFEIFVPRRQCMRFEADVVWTHFVADLLIAAAYFSIPFALVHFVRRRRDLDFHRLFWLFALFIILCGATHLFGIVALWAPVYRLEAVVKLATGLVSCATAFLLWRLMPQALAIPSPAQLRLRNEQLADEVTERKRAEERFQQLNADLEDRVRARTAELERIEAHLREANRRKDEFLATLAHELRNPLAPIRNGLHILRKGKDPSTERVREMMDRQLSHMVRLIDDLLDVSRITSGKVALRRERVSIQSAVELALEANRPHFQASRHTLTVDMPAEPIWVHADLTRLSQVVGNLLANAAKYTPEGGRVTLSAAREGEEVVLRVADTGLGIPEEMLTEVFEMFTQVNRHLERSQGGLGIGLALVKALVEKHGGSIVAESDGPGRGSTFTVRLPALAEEPARRDGPPPGAGAAPAAPGEGLRVLVVDDNRDGAESLSELLLIAGHVTRTAYDGPGALAAARELRPDVVILDIGLPGMSGYDVARRMRADPALGQLYLVALTGWGTEDDRRKASEAGFDLHLTKPVDAATVHEVLSRRATATSGPRSRA